MQCSIRQRLSAWYSISLILILLCSGVFWYLHLSRSLVSQADSRLLEVAVEMAASDPGALEETSHIAPFCAPNSLIRQNTWTEYIQIRGPQGDITCRSPNLGKQHLPLSAEALTRSRNGEVFFETVTFDDDESLRLLTYPTARDSGSPILVQVATDMISVEKPLRELLIILGIFSPLAVIVLSFAGWFLAKKALAPVDRIITQVNEIDATNLTQRLPKVTSDDEIGRLVDTFNSMLDRLEESFKKVRQFTGDASHELRTPLAILQGETEVCLRWAKDLEEYRQTLESNLEEIQRMGRIIEDLLTLSKEEAGTAPLVLETFNLTDLLQDLYLQGKTLGEPRNIDVSLKMEVSEDPEMRGDKWRLHQMLLNIVANGIKYTPEGGSLKITLRVENECAIVAISDTGIGIEPEHLSHVFDRFYRTDEARNRSEGGTGLGLAIAQLIARAHNGSITVESEIGEGSTFTCYIPLCGPPENNKNL
ncbi:MAG: ATP-binding protein [Desulfuromonadales bacterium]